MSDICSCGNRFDGDNLCMKSACQEEGMEPVTPVSRADRLVQAATKAAEPVYEATMCTLAGCCGDFEGAVKASVVAVLRELAREYYGRPGWSDNGDEFDALADTLEENRDA